MGPRRRGITAAAVGALLATSAATTSWATARERDHATSMLHSQTVAMTSSGERVFVDAAGLHRLIPGTRAVDEPAAAAQRAWLAQGRVPGAGGPWEGMARAALLDLHVLTGSDGAATAGWSTRWRYVWPRDGAFVAAAFARSGHTRDAEQVLAFLQRVQPASGRLQARYTPDGSGATPDDRGEEPDGAGWVLWSAGQLASVLDDPARRQAALDRLRPLLTRSTRACLDVLAEGEGLPLPGLDYWEIPQNAPTLGLAAPILAGLEAAPALLREIGEPALAAEAQAAAAALDRTITRRFGGGGYPRELGGRARDAALTFLLPPFRTAPPSPDLLSAWRTAQSELRRPAGGLAPGGDWRRDGVSWTPETALFALTAAQIGEPEVAAGWLGWLDMHRTAAGSLSEKVQANGQPAAVAPLAWTAALVVLAVESQDQKPPISVTTG